MKLTDITKELAKLFDAMGDAGGVVVWHDPDGEFAQAVDELELPGVEVSREEENDLFRLKAELNGDLGGRRVLLYRPRERRLEGDWLADVEVRAEQFSADYASIQMRELGAPDTREMRDALRSRKAFMAKKTNVKRLAQLRDSYQTPQELDLSIMAVALGATKAEPVCVVRRYLELAEQEGAADAFGRLEAAGVGDSFREALAAWTGFGADVTDARAVQKHVLLSALALLGLDGALKGLGAFVSAGHGAFCHEVFAGWLAEGDREALLDVAVAVEAEAKLDGRLSAAGSATLSELSLADVFPCIDAVILRRLMDMLCAGADGADEVLQIAGRRRGLAWYGEFDCYYQGVIAAANMRRFYQAHAEGMGARPAERVWEAYASDWHTFDRWYRELHLALSAAIMGGSYDLDECLRTVCDAMERLYKGWFLPELNGRWGAAIEPELASQGYVSGIPRQVDFYMNKVDSLAQGKRRAWVIVSDALRYEVAAELAERLERETKGACDLTAMQSALPSVTKCGMAALLPHGSLALEAGVQAGKPALKVLVDGAEVPTCASRQEAIRRTHPVGVAVQYEAFIGEMGRSERRELVGEADVVYVYHNVIDALGDKPGTERKVFQGCRDAIAELVAAVKVIVKDFGASDVLITADHGFLYTDQPLGEPEHASVDDVAGEVVECGRRYVVAAEGATSEFLMPARLLGARGVCGLFPRECVRIRRAGGGENYVHGGVSLQEMCVPVLHFKNRRRGQAGFTEATPAGIEVVLASNVISNSLFSLDFLQTQPVGGKVLPAEYEVYVSDASHAPVTDVARIVADKTAESSQERTVRVGFSLRTGFSPDSTQEYPLLARNTQTGEVAELAILRMQIAFAPMSDFGW